MFGTGGDMTDNNFFEEMWKNPKNDKMDFSRYPFSSNYDYHFYVIAPRNVEVDLDNFVIRFEEIKTNLDNLIAFASGRQYMDWTQLRNAHILSSEHRKAVTDLASKIRNLNADIYFSVSFSVHKS